LRVSPLVAQSYVRLDEEDLTIDVVVRGERVPISQLLLASLQINRVLTEFM
jgi:hypothetical protein